MKTMIAPLFAVAAIAPLTEPARADQAVLQFQFAHDGAQAGPITTPDAGQSTPNATSRVTPNTLSAVGVPKGVPGAYDPTTRTFKPLARAADGPASTGTVTAQIHISAESGIGPDDTVVCDFTVAFGNVAGSPGQWYPNHSVRGSTNFAAGEPVETIDVPFSYTPNGSGTPYMRLSLTCRVNYASDGTAHQGGSYLGVQPIGTATVPFNIQL